MVPFAISGSGLLVITIAISIALVILVTLFRGEREFEREHPDAGEEPSAEQPPDRDDEHEHPDGAAS